MPVICYQCQKCFSTRFNLNKHLKNVHHSKNTLPTKEGDTKFVCLDCNLFYKRNKDLRLHLEAVHDWDNMVEEWTFENYNVQEQKTENVHYVRRTGDKVATEGTERQYFECRGSFIDPPTNSVDKEKIYSQGKLKKSACVSQIVMKKNTATDECLVTYYKSHYLHNKSDLKHLKIPNKDDEIVGSKLSSGVPKVVPFKTISENQDSQLDESVKRLDTEVQKKSIPLLFDDLESLETQDDADMFIRSAEQTLDSSETDTPSPDIHCKIEEMRFILMQIIGTVENNVLSTEQLELISKNLNMCIDLVKK